MRLAVRISPGTLLASILLAVAIAAPRAEADSWVNCDTEGPEQLQYLLNTVPDVHGPGGAGVLHVAGTCYGTFRVIHHRNFTIRGVSSGGNVAVLDAQHRGPAMEIQNIAGGWLHLDNLTFRNGVAEGNGGGGISIYGTQVTIMNSAIVHNQGGYWGGGILSYGHLVIRSSYIGQNQATMGGGVFVHDGGADVSDTVITENHAASHGGGITAGRKSQVSLVHSIVSSNTSETSTPGVSAGFLDVKGSVISNNRSQAHAHGALEGDTQVLVENSSIAGNSGGKSSIAGGIVSGHVSLKNSTVANNTGSTVGGVYGHSVIATATTFTGNRSTSTEGVGGSGAIYALNPPNLRASILAGNHGVNPECYSTYPVVSFGYNLVGNGKGCTWSFPAAGDRIGTPSAPIDAKLGPIEHHFRAGTYILMSIFPLKAGSPAIDAIPPSACPLAHDQRGKTRPSGAGCDIGAFEKHPGD